MQQKRLILALALSSAILFAWQFFYPVTQPKNNQNNSNASASPTPTPLNQTSTASTPGLPSALATTKATTERRSLTVLTPLYKVKFDSQGAEPVSWIILKNRSSGRDIHSVAGTKKDPVDLELISPEGLKRQPRQVPLQLQTGDSG